MRQTGLKHDWDDTELAVCTAREACDVNAINAQMTVVISCWSLGENEDMRMWDVYGEKSSNAVALETEIRFLRKALNRDFLFIPVIYEHHLDIPSKELSLETFFHKRQKYDWEKELRIVAEMEKGKKIGTPRRVPLVLQKLPCRFIVAPGASIDRRIEVERQVRKYGIGGEVTFSSLSEAEY